MGVEAAAWTVLDDHTVIGRCHDPVDTDPIVTFAEALAAIIGGTYPQARPGQQWYFGHPGEYERSRCASKGSHPAKTGQGDSGESGEQPRAAHHLRCAAEHDF
jgi:hypothetical protein